MGSMQTRISRSVDRSYGGLLKNGFTLEGIFRHARIWTGQGLIDIDHFAKLREDIVGLLILCSNGTDRPYSVENVHFSIVTELYALICPMHPEKPGFVRK